MLCNIYYLKKLNMAYLLHIQMNIGMLSIGDLYTLIAVAAVSGISYLSFFIIVQQASISVSWVVLKVSKKLKYTDIFDQKNNAINGAMLLYSLYMLIVLLVMIIAVSLGNVINYISPAMKFIGLLVTLILTIATVVVFSFISMPNRSIRLFSAFVFTFFALLIGLGMPGFFTHVSLSQIPIKALNLSKGDVLIVAKRDELIPLINSAKHKGRAILKKHLDCSDNSQFCTLVNVNILFQGIGSNTKIRVPISESETIDVTIPNSSIIAIYDAPIKAHNKADTNKDKQ
ncbi:hypothetical protein, partial [Cysteiniphilum halobium]|uniref:hypothetical protein n=1 Tax=Cysteiniphilum halobium TaxID=2219059 RepID=UPI001AAC9EA2